MKIEALLTEAEISEEFAEAMEARDIPEKFFYWHPLCVRAWQALSQDVAYESRLHSWNLLIDDAEKISSHLDSIVAVISLGAGAGSQDVALLKALQSVKLDVDYFPVDASQGLLEMACAAAEDEEVDTLGLKADISSPMHLVLAADASENPKLFLLCGNTLGGFDPKTLTAQRVIVHGKKDLLVDLLERGVPIEPEAARILAMAFRAGKSGKNDKSWKPQKNGLPIRFDIMGNTLPDQKKSGRRRAVTASG